MRLGPVAFLFLVIGGWVLVRAVVLWPVRLDAPERRMAWAPPLRPIPSVFDPSAPFPSVSSEVGKRPVSTRFASRLRSKPTGEVERRSVLVASVAAAVQQAELRRSAGIALVPSPLAHQARRFSMSTWALVRSDISPGLATAGQLGGSQVGIRASYRVLDRVYLAARVSTPTGSNRGKEAALALDVIPVKSLPLTVSIERRLALDGGARSAFGIGILGGFDRAIAPRTRLDGYGQAGVVGLRSRDVYADGAVRAERELASFGRVRIGAGAGLWAGAQPGVSRLDGGPQVVAHAPVGPLLVRLGAEWRQRIAGKARPGSGPVLSLGADF